MADGYQEEASLLRHGNVRVGGCTAGCGACCRFLILPLDPKLLEAPPDRFNDWRRWVNYHGIRVRPWEGGLAAQIPLPCEHLEDDGTCGVFGTPDRPRLCENYPKHPLDLTGVEDVCTYIFESVGDDSDAAIERARRRLAERLKEAADEQHRVRATD